MDHMWQGAAGGLRHGWAFAHSASAVRDAALERAARLTLQAHALDGKARDIKKQVQSGALGYARADLEYEQVRLQREALERRAAEYALWAKVLDGFDQTLQLTVYDWVYFFGGDE